MEHGKHAGRQRRVQRRPHLIVPLLVSLLVSSPVSFLLVPFIVQPFRPVLIVSTSRRAIREAGRFFSSDRLIRRVRIHHAPRRFRQLILSAISSCRPAPSSRRAYVTKSFAI